MKTLALLCVAASTAMAATPAARPRINGPKAFGVRPGRPFFYAVPAVGRAPLRFTAKGLPAGLTLNSATGRITGRLGIPGEYRVRLGVRNAEGASERDFKIVVGETLALTPPMGWSTWYCARTKISDAYIRAQADAMVSSGMAAHGYSYVDIDDGWNIMPGSPEPEIGGEPRDSRGNLRPNRNFPDMKALADYVHGKGLKIGLYSSPGPLTCGKYAGSLGHESQDARQFAEWGFDLLKYDWCSYKDRKKVASREEWEYPYRVMAQALARQDRDILFNLCQYGLGEVWSWGREAGGHFWRSGDDLGWVNKSLWDNLLRFGFGLAGTERWAGPGGWNDPDNIMIGHIILSISGKGRTPLGPTPLTPDEQYAHMSLWAIAASPLMFGGDMTKLDEFTLGLLTNDEVIDVNLDLLGRQAGVVSKAGDVEIWAKDLEDGSKAVGLFNRGESEAQATARWQDLSLAGSQPVRDLWKRKDLGRFDGAFTAAVPRHGAVLVRVGGRAK
jgi:alpha-galactosidase